MTAILLTLAVFAYFGLVGLGGLAAAGADLGDLRVALSAPVLGSAITVLPLFVLSRVGLGMAAAPAPVTAGVLFVLAVVVLIRRRLRPPLSALPVVLVCLWAVVVVGLPMFTYGFDWVANANDDMANYVLSATHLVRHGLLGPVGAGVAHDRDFASVTRQLHDRGSRPGADLLLAGLTAIVRRPTYQLFMPLILAFMLSGIAAVGALALQVTRRPWSAWAAAALLAVSPAAGYGVLQQLFSQVYGLGLAAVLVAWLFRPNLYAGRGAARHEVAVIAVLASALVLGYVELAGTIALAYALFVAALALQRRLALRAALRMWVPAIAFAFVVLNRYLISLLRYVGSQTGSGTTARAAEHTTSFPYSLVPSALAWIAGWGRIIPSGVGPALLALEIVAAIVTLAAVLAAMVWTARRGIGAVYVLFADLLLGLYLGAKSSDFGLFKLYMYVQPFLAAAAGAWLGLLAGRRRLLAAASIVVAAVIVLRVPILVDAVIKSRDPVDLRHASSSGALPQFRATLASSASPIVATTDNRVLTKLEASLSGGRPLYLLGDDVFGGLGSGTTGWRQVSFPLPGPAGPRLDRFAVDPRTSALLRSGDCTLVMSSGSLVPVNRRTLADGSPVLVDRPCAALHDVLVFTQSGLGERYILPRDTRRVSFHQLERDPLVPGTFAATGRYALFAVLGAGSTVRLELDFTTSALQDGRSALPPARVVGEDVVRFPTVGRGSARVFSPPVRPRLIDGIPYLLLDLGAPEQLLSYRLTGLGAIYGSGVNLDPRSIVGWTRDLSALSDAAFSALPAPASLSAFPHALENPDLEYSGIYEDGWVGERSYAMLAGGSPARLVVRTDYLVNVPGQRLDVLVGGHRVASEAVGTSQVDLAVRLPASRGKRRVELRWRRAVRLGPLDARPAAAHLSFLGVEPLTVQAAAHR